jgi:hypothetical protein
VVGDEVAREVVLEDGPRLHDIADDVVGVVDDEVGHPHVAVGVEVCAVVDVVDDRVAEVVGHREEVVADVLRDRPRLRVDERRERDGVGVPVELVLRPLQFPVARHLAGDAEQQLAREHGADHPVEAEALERRVHRLVVESEGSGDGAEVHGVRVAHVPLLFQPGVEVEPGFGGAETMVREQDDVPVLAQPLDEPPEFGVHVLPEALGDRGVPLGVLDRVRHVQREVDVVCF